METGRPNSNSTDKFHWVLGILEVQLVREHVLSTPDRSEMLSRVVLKSNLLEVNLEFTQTIWEVELLPNVSRNLILMNNKITWCHNLLKLVLKLLHLC